MNIIRVKLLKIKNHYYIRLPKIVTELFKFQEGDEIEIDIHPRHHSVQTTLWDGESAKMTDISFTLSEDTSTINMYHRIYVPVRYRFFFPPAGVDFLLETNLGNIQTHLTSGGFFARGMRQWVDVNGPLGRGDRLNILSLSNERNRYKLVHKKKSSDSSNDLE